ncbi:uncharacterized protein LOC118428676 [Branchiostoma floridae]|uniref:Uncharacterized protein LOC118428676 n=1 Tax=Branchiostoma floridae TaxID=7739 RepID=A0A9J7M5H2_BRAFL|nr:uncharacterized protein LOC118428676 [Branchiostoma floridae]
MIDPTAGVKANPEGKGVCKTDAEGPGDGKTDAEGPEVGKTPPRRGMVFGLAAALLLVTGAAVTGGLLAYFRGKDGPNVFTLQASVGGQTVREEVEFDRRSGAAVYRDVGGTQEGEIVQTREGLLVLYWQGGCYLLEKNGTREMDIGSAEAAVEVLSVLR